jgi:hypothetical protein
MNPNDQALIEKALRSTSESEAIACLRMARKRGITFGVTDNKPSVDNSNDSYWKSQYVNLYKVYEKNYNSYKNQEKVIARLQVEIKNSRRGFWGYMLFTFVLATFITYGIMESAPAPSCFLF